MTAFAELADRQDGDELAAQFDRAGAILVRGVLAPDEVRAVRDAILQGFAPLDHHAEGRVVRNFSADMFLRCPNLWVAVTHPRIVAALRAILEPDYSVIPDFHVHRNMFDFTNTRRSMTHLFGLIGHGWHHDAGAEGTNPYLFERDYRTVKCGLYLQDNTVEWGGGIEIALGGHRRVSVGNPRLDYPAMRSRQNVRILTGSKILDIKAGDFVAFDSWLPHRGVNPSAYAAGEDEKQQSYAKLPPEHTKLVIYYNASRTRYARNYVAHSLNRGRSEFASIGAKRGREVFFADYPGLCYPVDYPADFIASLERQGLSMAQLDGAELQEARELRRKVLDVRLIDNWLPR